MEEHPNVSFSYPHSNHILLLIKLNISFLVLHSHFYVAAKGLYLHTYPSGPISEKAEIRLDPQLMDGNG
jgi:hypothetical protein